LAPTKRDRTPNLAEQSSKTLKVSVIVPTYNRLDRLRRVLDAFASQTTSPKEFEVIVVSDGSTDGTDGFLRSAATPFPLLATSRANGGPAAARNTGVRLATGHVLLFVDDDVVPQVDLVEQHLTTHQQAGAQVVVIGPMLTPADHHPNAFVRWEQAMLYKQYHAMMQGHYEPTHRQFYTGNASVGRDFLLATGGFDERFRRAEDVELAYRLHDQGARFIFNPKAIGYHYAERSFGSWIQNARAYGRNDVLFDRYYGRVNRLEGVKWEFTQRHSVIRWLTLRCIGRPWLEASLHLTGRVVAKTADGVGLEGVVRTGLSATYLAEYYSGMAEELGGRRAFRELIAGTRIPESLGYTGAVVPDNVQPDQPSDRAPVAAGETS
jgi:GT2 family glycosyltransferase